MAPEDAESQFREKFRLDDLTVYENADWTLSVRPGQPVLGALVLSTKHGALGFAALPPESAVGMLALLARAEAAAKELFGAVRINALCLMMADPLFHFHVLPRYMEAPELGGKVWVDSGWPGLPNLADNHADDSDLGEILRAYAAFPWQ